MSLPARTVKVTRRAFEMEQVTWVTRILRDQHMPPDEIHLLASTTDPGLVHRYLELHRERLEEWLADQRHTLATIEQVLTDAAHDPTTRSGVAPPA
jgi:DNA-binding transcriptional MerR regulator